MKALRNEISAYLEKNNDVSNGLLRRVSDELIRYERSERQADRIVDKAARKEAKTGSAIKVNDHKPEAAKVEVVDADYVDPPPAFAASLLFADHLDVSGMPPSSQE